MFIVESIHTAKKKLIKFWKDYFTIEGTYTSLLPDRIYLKKLYKKRLNKELNLKKPVGFNEKLNWIKLYDRKPEYTMMADKYAVRDYIARVIGKEYLVPLIGVWDNVNDIDFDLLPQEFVLKCNHDNGVIVCRNKKHLDYEKIKSELEFRLNRNYYKKAREWVYKNIDRKIICEEYIKSDGDLIDYKFYCFSGEAKFLVVATERSTGAKFNYFDIQFNPMSISQGLPFSDKKIAKPKHFEKMVSIAEKLSANIPHVRVDLYNIDGQIYFGELTFFDSAGFELFEPTEWENRIGDWINLPKKYK